MVLSVCDTPITKQIVQHVAQTYSSQQVGELALHSTMTKQENKYIARIKNNSSSHRLFILEGCLFPPNDMYDVIRQATQYFTNATPQYIGNLIDSSELGMIFVSEQKTYRMIAAVEKNGITRIELTFSVIDDVTGEELSDRL